MLVELLINFTDGHRTAKIMTTKPEFTKPFNKQQAEAGAPFCQTDGDKVQVFAWNLDGLWPIAGIADGNLVGKCAAVWDIEGNVNQELMGARASLVMIPLGFIDGKPVWVGDHFITSGGLPCIATTASAGDFKGCSWPAPAPVYPETHLTGSALAAVYMTYDIDPTLKVRLTNVANFALHHALDAGQVVLPITQARELAIAEAAAKAVYDKVYQFGRPRTAYCDMGLDLPAIIAGVAK